MQRTQTVAACLALAVWAGFLSSGAPAQVLTPRASPAASVGMKIGTTDVEVRYHRPAVKGRKIWGGLVPYGEVWRLGANDATTVRFSDPVKMEGKDVPAGTYAFFAIPGPDAWTLILNRRAEQWGAYFYKESEDLLRFQVKPQTGPHAEWMSFSLTPATPESAVLEMAWETLRLPVRIDVDVPRIVWGNLDKAIAEKPDADNYLYAVNYALERGERLDEAMTWVDKALALEEGFWGYEAKAKLLQRAGKADDALPLLDKAIALARGKAPQGYIDGLEAMKAAWKQEA
ncbi:MAG TPA: DUF2911 domain-containing protein [Thermoanaerobaculia bacterium]|nr:DUF2911 domain-containing protein [Thermoanaerobaculia bacterium]